MHSKEQIRHRKPNISILLFGIVFLVFVNSCAKKCDCSDVATTSISLDDTALLTSRKYIRNLIQNGDTSMFAFEICNPDIIDQNLLEQSMNSVLGTYVIINGDVKAGNCGGLRDFRGPFIKLTSIKKLN